MPETETFDVRLLSLAQVAEILSVAVDEVMMLITEGRIRGVRVGGTGRWRVDQSSVSEYLDDQAEEARRMALWHESNAASFPELWGTGVVRSPD
jgi:excisionase family DNA binding protein